MNPTHSPPVALARAYGRYGYRRITALLNEAGWDVSVSRVARIWRREGLKVPGRQPKRRYRPSTGPRRFAPERLALRRAVLPERRTGTALRHLQLTLNVLDASTPTRGA